MRKIFAATALSAVAGAVLFGGVFAWRTSDSARGAALVGSNGFEIKYEPNCNGILPDPYLDFDVEEAGPDVLPIPCHTLIGPNGSTTEVGRGIGKNEGDFKLVVVGGELSIRGVHHSASACRPEHFGGAVRILDPGEVIPPGGEGGKFAAFISVRPNAPADCQGEVVYYKVSITAENPGLTPAEPGVEAVPASS